MPGTDWRSNAIANSIPPEGSGMYHRLAQSQGDAESVVNHHPYYPGLHDYGSFSRPDKSSRHYPHHPYPELYSESHNSSVVDGQNIQRAYSKLGHNQSGSFDSSGTTIVRGSHPPDPRQWGPSPMTVQSQKLYNSSGIGPRTAYPQHPHPHPQHLSPPNWSGESGVNISTGQIATNSNHTMQMYYPPPIHTSSSNPFSTVGGTIHPHHELFMPGLMHPYSQAHPQYQQHQSLRGPYQFPPIEYITDIHPQDVLSGRGGGTNSHSGNRSFRALVKSYQAEYLQAKKRDKPSVAAIIVDQVRQRGGRFLRRMEDPHGTLLMDPTQHLPLYVDIGDERAKEKTCQALREGAPEIRKKKHHATNVTAPSRDDNSIKSPNRSHNQRNDQASDVTMSSHNIIHANRNNNTPPSSQRSSLAAALSSMSSSSLSFENQQHGPYEKQNHHLGTADATALVARNDASRRSNDIHGRDDEDVSNSRSYRGPPTPTSSSVYSTPLPALPQTSIYYDDHYPEDDVHHLGQHDRSPANRTTPEGLIVIRPVAKLMPGRKRIPPHSIDQLSAEDRDMYLAFLPPCPQIRTKRQRQEDIRVVRAQYSSSSLHPLTQSLVELC